MDRRARMRLIVLLLLAAAPASATADDVTPGAWLDEHATAAVEHGYVMGLVIGWFDGDRVEVRAYGRLSAEDPRVPDADTLFEIGSITKVFTGVLLADAVQRGHVTLETPVATLLPGAPRIGPPERPVTLLDLTTHTSGLPRLPANLLSPDPADPYADYTVEALWTAVDGVALEHAPGTAYAYSNLGAGLLGHALALVAARAEGSPADLDAALARGGYAGDGSPVAGAHDAGWEALVRARVLAPLGMDDTRVVLDAARRARLAPGHDADLEPVPTWSLPTLAGAGALRSSATDMLRFARAAAGLDEVPLRRTLALSLVPRRTVEGEVRMGLGWHVVTSRGRWLHGGQTGGYHAFLAIEPDGERGVVQLANTATSAVDALGEGLLARLAGRPASVPSFPASADVPDEVLASYEGLYALLPGVVVDVTRDARGLRARLTGQPALRLHPLSETEFRYRAVDARVVFETDEAGTPRFVLHQNGRILPAPRIERP